MSKEVITIVQVWCDGGSNQGIGNGGADNGLESHTILKLNASRICCPYKKYVRDNIKVLGLSNRKRKVTFSCDGDDSKGNGFGAQRGRRH